MKNTLLMSLPLLAILAVSCSKSNKEETPVCNGGVTEFNLDEPFYLCYGTEAHWTEDANFTVKFNDIFGDSRCPNDSLILCVWQGRADAGVVSSIWDFSQTDTLSAEGLSNAAIFDSTVFSNYKIELLAIEPYPTATNSPIPQEDYKLKLLITQ
jgi:hypothetical protein